jgi:hypothetical protein
MDIEEEIIPFIIGKNQGLKFMKFNEEDWHKLKEIYHPNGIGNNALCVRIGGPEDTLQCKLNQVLLNIFAQERNYNREVFIESGVDDDR